MDIIKKNADIALYDMGLFDELKKYGVPHIVGSYAIDAMAWNDLDIDVNNENMNIERLYRLTTTILNNFKPTWYEAKQELTDEGKTVWFHGFEAVINDELWNFDIWFFDNETIQKAEKFCNDIKLQLDSDIEKKNAVIQIKKDLISQGLYSFDKYKSMDVYEAVLKNNILTMNQFLQHNEKQA